MAVKVVSDAPVRTKRVVCPNCCYELEFTGIDVKHHTDSDGDSMYWILCPVEGCKSRAGTQQTTVFVKWP